MSIYSIKARMKCNIMLKYCFRIHNFLNWHPKSHLMVMDCMQLKWWDRDQETLLCRLLSNRFFRAESGTRPIHSSTELGVFARHCSLLRHCVAWSALHTIQVADPNGCRCCFFSRLPLSVVALTGLIHLKALAMASCYWNVHVCPQGRPTVPVDLLRCNFCGR